METISEEALLNDLLEAGVHYGHQTRRWNPKMKQFIYGKKSSIYVINLEKTVRQLKKAADHLAETARRGRKILFVGCKRQAQEAIKESAEACGQLFVNHRWLGGTLTNLATIRASVARLEAIEKLKKTPDFMRLPKKEVASLNREVTKLHRNLDGLRSMDDIPDTIVIIDTVREHIAVSEARRLGVTTVAISDTNSDPDEIDFPIPGNDDAIRSIRVILQYLVSAIVNAQQSGPFRPGAAAHLDRSASADEAVADLGEMDEGAEKEAQAEGVIDGPPANIDTGDDNSSETPGGDTEAPVEEAEPVGAASATVKKAG